LWLQLANLEDESRYAPDSDSEVVVETELVMDTDLELIAKSGSLF